MTAIKPIVSLTLDLPPSCVAFCPTQPQYFVVGTYLLHHNGDHRVKSEVIDAAEASDSARGVGPQRQLRSGSLELYQFQDDEIARIAVEPTPLYSVLDIEWAPYRRPCGDLLAVATSTGSLAFYQLCPQGNRTQLAFKAQKQICDQSVLILDLVWHPRQWDIIGVTLSDGRVCICQSNEGDPWSQATVLSLHTIITHSLEAWTLAFSSSSTSPIEIISGGDDLLLQRASISCETHEHALLWQDRRIHQAGVTAILALTSELIVTGSYDDHIRLISAPSQKPRTVLADEDLGGGVWRLKALPPQIADAEPSADAAISTLPTAGFPNGTLILASCMHAGARLVRLSRDPETETWEFEVLARFEEHKSMNYGSDVQPQRGHWRTFVTTSFYDKLLCLWRYDLETAESGAVD